MKESLNKLVGTASVLVLIPDKSERFQIVAKSANNLEQAKVLNANYLNIRDLLGYDKVLMSVEALDVIRTYLG